MIKSRYASLLIPLLLTGCTAAGLASLAMEGMQLASGGSQSGPSGNTAPFAVQDHSQAVQELNDVLGRTISATCTDDLDKRAVSPSKTDSPAAGSAHDAESAQAVAEEQCGYRSICLPGRSTPLMMFVCSGEGGAVDAGGAPALPNRAPPQGTSAQSAAN